ncbi:MAG: hypothetical protein QGG40_22670, partial [Myxococcota bacterium]|nr:hypothetical protein [Myxococcota bacterium]
MNKTSEILIALGLAATLTVACSETPPSQEAPSTQEGPSLRSHPEAPSQLDLSALGADLAEKALVPAPRELENAVRSRGLTDALHELVPDRSFDSTKESEDIIAIRTGVTLADAILTCRTSSKETFLARLHDVHSGLTRIGAGAGLLDYFQELIQRIENDAATRDEFLNELDDFTSMMVPEEGWGPEDQTGPLLQAGAWMEGANLVSAAIIKANKPEAASDLLRQRAVVDYFVRYVRTDGQ